MKPFVSIKITTQNLPWLSIGSIFEGLGRLRESKTTITTTTTLTCPTTIQGVVGSSSHVFVLYFTFFDLILFVVTYGAPVEDFKAKSMGEDLKEAMTLTRAFH